VALRKAFDEINYQFLLRRNQQASWLLISGLNDEIFIYKFYVIRKRFIQKLT